MCLSGGGRKPIDEVQVGDLVVATDPETGEQAGKVVEAVFVHEDEVYGLSIGGETITTTEDHPFWSVTDQQFERADQLAAGEQVLAADGTSLVVARPVFRTETTRALAYNLTVGETHTYHVGETQTFVHNCGPGTSPVGVNDAPSRVAGPWKVNDLKQGAHGHPPRSLGSPDLHHGDQMPGREYTR